MRSAARSFDAPASLLTRTLADWFASVARPLPWRTAPRDPYLALVSEFMLHQTQVSRVLQKFTPFIARFPSLSSLAAAPEHDVLALWSGLGYYRRARLLHAAAKDIASRFNSRIPATPADLLSLPGIGRYTAGSIASIVFNKPEPIVDGNVARVLLRLRGRPLSPASPTAQRWLWKESAALAAAAGSRIAAFNEGLMELGATICTPKSPDCAACPLSAHCLARARNLTHRIPKPKPAPRTKLLHMDCLLLRDRRGRVLLHPRPSRGLWPGLWQTPTLENPLAHPTRASLAAAFNTPNLQPLDHFERLLSHRRVSIRVWTSDAPPSRCRAIPSVPDSRWITPAELPALPLSSLTLRVLEAPKTGKAAKTAKGQRRQMENSGTPKPEAAQQQISKSERSG